MAQPLLAVSGSCGLPGITAEIRFRDSKFGDGRSLWFTGKRGGYTLRTGRSACATSSLLQPNHDNLRMIPGAHGGAPEAGSAGGVEGVIAFFVQAGSHISLR